MGFKTTYDKYGCIEIISSNGCSVSLMLSSDPQVMALNLCGAINTLWAMVEKAKEDEKKSGHGQYISQMITGI